MTSTKTVQVESRTSSNAWMLCWGVARLIKRHKTNEAAGLQRNPAASRCLYIWGERDWGVYVVCHKKYLFFVTKSIFVFAWLILYICGFIEYVSGIFLVKHCYFSKPFLYFVTKSCYFCDKIKVKFWNVTRNEKNAIIHAIYSKSTVYVK